MKSHRRPVFAGLAFLAAAGTFFSAGALIAPPWAGATNVDVTVTGSCVGSTWRITLTATNTHTAPLHVVNDNSVENWVTTLDAKGGAHATRSIPIDAPGQTFHYIWSSTDAHLVGTIEATLARPIGCTRPTTTTTVPSATSPPPTPAPAVATSILNTPPSSDVPPTSSSSTAPEPASAPRPPAPAVVTTVPRLYLPPTS